MAKSDFPTLDTAKAEAMKQQILAAKEQGDSVGGVIECAAFGVPAGLGEPFFGSVERLISSAKKS